MLLVVVLMVCTHAGNVEARSNGKMKGKSLRYTKKEMEKLLCCLWSGRRKNKTVDGRAATCTERSLRANDGMGREAKTMN